MPKPVLQPMRHPAGSSSGGRFTAGARPDEQLVSGITLAAGSQTVDIASASMAEVAAMNPYERLQQFHDRRQPGDGTPSIMDVYCEVCEEAFIEGVTEEEYGVVMSTFPELCPEHELERRS